jgi:hypothetical protein
MARKSPNPALSIVAPAPTPPPPPIELREHGLALWASIHRQYRIVDAGGIALLAQICRAWDRAEALRARIDDDGEVLTDKGGNPKSHPSLRDEIACQAFIARGLERLGLNLEPLRATAGRPGGKGLACWIPPTAAE